MKQWDLSNFTINSINNSETDIPVNGTSLSDIKLANDGRIYIYDQQNNELDRLNEPWEPAADVEYQDGAVTGLENLTAFFPNTANFICGFNPIFNFIPQTACLGDTVFFDLSFNISPDSLLWDFGDPNTDLDTSTEISNSYVFEEVGIYDASVTAWIDSLEYTISGQYQIFESPEVDLGEDQTICEGEELILDAGEAMSYVWTPNANTQTIQVTETGTYSVTVMNGQCADEDEVNIIVIPLPSPSLESPVNLCNEVEYTIVSQETGEWSTGDDGFETVVTETGVYTQTVIN
ncbi:MAG: hypothetical protein HRT74_03010 [Flavobacteriales bacterium]|nr:hypothetical protein [Flavobacteriales bacterium]